MDYTTPITEKEISFKGVPSILSIIIEDAGFPFAGQKITSLYIKDFNKTNVIFRSSCEIALNGDVTLNDYIQLYNFIREHSDQSPITNPVILLNETVFVKKEIVFQGKPAIIYFSATPSKGVNDTSRWSVTVVDKADETSMFYQAIHSPTVLNEGLIPAMSLFTSIVTVCF